MDLQVKIDVKNDRLKDEVTVDQWIGMQEGQLRAIRDVLSKFLVDDGGNLIPEDKARTILGKLTLNQLTEAGQEFIRVAEGTLVPEANGAD